MTINFIINRDFYPTKLTNFEIVSFQDKSEDCYYFNIKFSEEPEFMETLKKVLGNYYSVMEITHGEYQLEKLKPLFCYGEYPEGIECTLFLEPKIRTFSSREELERFCEENNVIGEEREFLELIENKTFASEFTDTIDFEVILDKGEHKLFKKEIYKAFGIDD